MNSPSSGRSACPPFWDANSIQVFQDQYAEWVHAKIATRAGAVANWQRANGAKPLNQPSTIKTDGELIMFGSDDPPEMDMWAEVARVQNELILFRDKLVPGFLNTPFDPSFHEDEAYVEITQARIADARRPISDWQRAACRLAELLPLGPLPLNAPKISRRIFRDILKKSSPETKVRPSFRIEGGRIIWEIELNVYRESLPSFAYGFPDLAAAMENLPARLADSSPMADGAPD